MVLISLAPKLCTVHSLSLIKNKNSIDIDCVKGQHAENFKVKVGQAKKTWGLSSLCCPTQ